MTIAHQPASRLIVIDDQPMMAKLVRQMVSPFDHEVVATGKDGVEGPALIAEHRPDALICDINMPKVNGLSLLKAIRCGRAGPRHDLPVLLLSGRSEGIVFKTALALDVNAFVVKPANVTNLIDRLHRALTIPRPIKEPDAYLRVPIPALDRDDAPLTPAAKPLVILRPPPGAQLLRLADLTPGAQLAAPILGGDSTVVIDAGEILTAELIERLMDMKELGVIADAAMICA